MESAPVVVATGCHVCSMVNTVVVWSEDARESKEIARGCHYCQEVQPQEVKHVYDDPAQSRLQSMML